MFLKILSLKKRFSAKIGYIQTFNLIVSSQVLYHCATATGHKSNRLFLKFQLLESW
jgi:hypothetical protein